MGNVISIIATTAITTATIVMRIMAIKLNNDYLQTNFT